MASVFVKCSSFESPPDDAEYCGFIEFADGGGVVGLAADAGDVVSAGGVEFEAKSPGL